MRIAFYELPPHLRVGGLETACRGLQAGLATAGHTVWLDPPPTDLARGDVAHFHGLWSIAHWKIARALRRRDIAFVSSPHGMLEPWAFREKAWKKRPYFYLLERPRLRAGRAILATADQEAARIRALLGPSARVEVLPLGTEMAHGPDYAPARQRLGWQPAEKVLLYLSRIHKKKGLLRLLEALQGIDPPLLANSRLVVVGDGDADYLRACREKASTLPVQLKVDWHPPVWTDAKWDYLAGADLMCLPTYSENFGMVVLEALQVGTPVLTTLETPWAAIGELGFGYVGPPDSAFFRDALARFLAEPGIGVASRQRRAEWAKANFAWASLIPRYEQLYHSLENST